VDSNRTMTFLDKDDETESEDEEPSQGIGNEGWENVFNELDQMEEEYQDSSVNNNTFQANMQKFAKELENLAHDDGALYREEHLYPDNNGGNILNFTGSFGDIVFFHEAFLHIDTKGTVPVLEMSNYMDFHLLVANIQVQIGVKPQNIEASNSVSCLQCLMSAKNTA
jgi:hypothetical protein